MIDYQIKITRWCPASGERRAAVFMFSGNEFHDAVRHAQGILCGMAAANPDSEFAIQSVEADGYNNTVVGDWSFLTIQEKIARDAEKEAAKQ